MASAIRLVADVKAVLGEGPVWVTREAALYWVDIKGRKLFRLAAGEVRDWPTQVRCGSIVPRQAGGFIAGTDDGIYSIDFDRVPMFEQLLDPEGGLERNRFNDGKVDRSGRFWAGSMDDAETASIGTLYRLDSPHACLGLDHGYSVPNGPAFSPAGDTLYHTDSARRTIYRFELAQDGSLGERSIFLQFTGAEGHPDGMTVDAEGCLWVAFWDGWAVRRFSAAGEALEVVETPVQRPTSVAFGGPALDQLYITSARTGLDDTALAVQPYAGGLFVVEPGVCGISEKPFAG